MSDPPGNVVALPQRPVCGRCGKLIAKGDRYYGEVRMPDGSTKPVHARCLESG